jgi:hypothetical protein
VAGPAQDLDLSLVRDGISNDLLAPVGYRQVARISGKNVVRIFGTRTGFAAGHGP